MGNAGAARQSIAADDLFGHIGEFLADHRLDHDPATYALIHRLLSAPDSMLAREVAQLTDGGIRLSRADVERLGGRVASSAGPERMPRPKTPPPEQEVAQLVAQTQAQVAGFADTMRKVQDETRDFGRDLADGAAAALRDPADLSRIAAAMVARVREADARLASATIEAEILRAKLVDAQVTARRDPMTGLPNRLAFTEGFAALAESTGPNCLALCDVDRFKRVNDEHGHVVGDRVLTAIGQMLTEACAGHLVVRHGGEEYAVILSGTTLAEAAVVMNGARERIAAKRFRNRDNEQGLGQITFSAGVIAIRDCECVEDATERADRLLYAAKGQGRDRICAG